MLKILKDISNTSLNKLKKKLLLTHMQTYINKNENRVKIKTKTVYYIDSLTPVILNLL